MILFIKHIDIEGPETIGAFFKTHGFRIKNIELYDGEKLPGYLPPFIKAVISLGGPMNVYQEKRYRFLIHENSFIQDVVRRNIPFMGICLGSQLLAKACQAQVVSSPQKEIGFSSIGITAEGQQDPLFKGLPEKIEVYQWHEDMSELPEGATLLASSAECPHQAFKVGQCAYGLQFHVEITDQSITEWSDRYFKDETVREREKKQMLAHYQRTVDSFNATAETIYNNFLKIMESRC